MTKTVLFKIQPKGDYTEKGTFLSWGMECIETSESVASYTVAIIQIQDGTITIVHPTWIKFI